MGLKKQLFDCTVFPTLLHQSFSLFLFHINCFIAATYVFVKLEKDGSFFNAV